VKISFERSGGVTGVRLEMTIESQSLSPTDRHELERLVETSGLRSAAASPSAAAPDRFQYRVTAELGRTTVELRVSEPDVPKAVRPLLDWLTERARIRN